MLTDDFRYAVGNPGPVASAAAVGLLLGLVIGFFTARGEADAGERQQASEAPTSPPGRSTAAAGDASRDQATMRAALERGVRVARRTGGEASAAVWVEGWPRPVVIGDRRRAMPMWSIAKPVVALAALRAAGGRPSLELREAMIPSIQRSENCPARRVTLGLQALAGSRSEAEAAFVDVLRASGVHDVAPPRQAAPAESHCRGYLRQHGTGVDVTATAPLFGTVRWSVQDAVTFAHALGTGRYGEPGKRVLQLMQLPKRRSREEGAVDTTRSADWGAGGALRRFRPAYKGGWGGAVSQERRFEVAQIVSFVASGRDVAVAAMYRPFAEPPADDPGATIGPQVLEDIFHRIGGVLGIRAADG